MNLRVNGRDIGTTAEHPFWVRGRGWVPAGELARGAELSGHDGRWVAVEEVHRTGEYATVYNLRVSDFHTYFVGGLDWGFDVWAHNEYKSGKTEKQVAGALEKAGVPEEQAAQLAKVGAVQGVNGDKLAARMAATAKAGNLSAYQWQLLGNRYQKAADEITRAREAIAEKLQDPLLSPGPNAKEGVPTKHPDIEDVTKEERKDVNAIGNKHGDHSDAKIKKPGAASGWVPDHQPVTELVRLAQNNPELKAMMKDAGLPTTLKGQMLYPQSLGNARTQGGIITAITSKLGKIERRLNKINNGDLDF
jgi:hypothetical protein